MRSVVSTAEEIFSVGTDTGRRERRLNIGGNRNCGSNPSVGCADSSLYTREPNPSVSLSSTAPLAGEPLMWVLLCLSVGPGQKPEKAGGHVWPPLQASRNSTIKLPMQRCQNIAVGAGVPDGPYVGRGRKREKADNPKHRRKKSVILNREAVKNPVNRTASVTIRDPSLRSG